MTTLATRLEALAADCSPNSHAYPLLTAAAAALRERDRDVEAAYREGWMDSRGADLNEFDDEWVKSTARRAITEGK
mgnify:CR=1 FL=1